MQARNARREVIPRDDSRQTKWLFPCILGCFIVLAVLYSVVNPIFESPDELQHFYHVRHIAQTWTLAVQDPAQAALYRQEGSQPPLYYLLGAALIAWVDTSDAESSVRENPHVNLGVPQAFGNKNMVVHTEAESFPYRGVSLAVHLLRLLSIGLGVMTVCATYALGREVFPDRPAVALLAATFNAFLPQFVFMSASVNNDVAVAATGSWTAVILVRFPRTGRFAPYRLSALAGALLGLSTLSKLSGLSLLPLAALSLLWWGWREHRQTEAFRHGLLVGVVVLAVAGWWYARNWLLYGDPLGLQTMLDVVGRRDGFGFADLVFELEGLRLSFWGLFGWFNVLMDRWVYHIYDGLLIAGTIGLVLAIATKPVSSFGLERFNRRFRRTLIIGLLVWQVVVFGALVYWTRSTTGSQGRLLFVTLAAFCVLWAAGLVWWLSRFVPSLEWPVCAVLALVWFGLALSAPFLYIHPAYARPPRLSVGDLPSSLNRLDITFDDKLRLLGYEMDGPKLSSESEANETNRWPTIKRGTPLALTLCWMSLAKMDRDYTVFVHLFGRGGRPIGQEDTYPGGGNAPTSEWQVGELMCDRYEVLVAPEAKAPSVGSVDVGVYDLETRERLVPYGSDMRPMERVLLAPFKVATWAPPRYDIGHPVHFELGEHARLVGYRVERELGAQGFVLNVSLYWQARGAPAEDYTVFVHLLDEEGQLVSQHDGEPVGGDYPTSFWDEGETVKDEHALTLPAGVELQQLSLRVGMYRGDTGQRLNVADAQGQTVGDSVLLPVE